LVSCIGHTAARQWLKRGWPLTQREENAMTDHRCRRSFQVSLKSLFLLTLVVAAFFAGYSLANKQAERERRQVRIEAQRQIEEARAQADEANRRADEAARAFIW
jgi:hypothetical protein